MEKKFPVVHNPGLTFSIYEIPNLGQNTIDMSGWLSLVERRTHRDPLG